MILTCPSCSTRYFAQAQSIGPEGRMVKCAACGHKWKAMPDTELSDDDLDMLEPSPSPAPQPKAPEPVSEEPIPSSVRRVVQTQRRERAAKRGWLVWGAAAGVMLSLLATSVLFRNSVVSFWPKAASAYAVLGLQTSERGLVFGDIVAERLQQPSGPVLALRTSVTNISGQVRQLPFVRVSMQDENDREVAAWIVAVDQAVVQGRRRVSLQASIPAPPVDARGIRLEFIDEPDLATPIVYGSSESV